MDNKFITYLQGIEAKVAEVKAAVGGISLDTTPITNKINELAGNFNAWKAPWTSIRAQELDKIAEIKTMTETIDTNTSEKVDFIMLEVELLGPDCDVEIQCGESIIRKRASNGSAVFPLTRYGTWDVRTYSGGTTYDRAQVFVETAKYYKVSLMAVPAYGVKIDMNNTNPSTAVTYVGMASGKGTGWSSWQNEPIFKNIKPCALNANGVKQFYLNKNDYTLKEQGGASGIHNSNNYDVMVEIPKMGFRIIRDKNDKELKNDLYVYVTTEANVPGFCYLAHSKNSVGDCDFIYVGAYYGNNVNGNLRSISGRAPTVNQTLTVFRQQAQKRAGYELYNFYAHTLLQCLYLIIYRNRDSQSALGRGYVDGNSAAANTGGANKRAFCSAGNGNQQMKFLGIEDFWGNLWGWCDGYYCDSNRNILTAYKGYNDNGSGYPYRHITGVASNQSGYFLDVAGDNAGGFMPTIWGGSSSTGFCDNGYLAADYCLDVGGYWSYGDIAGAFYANGNSASYSSSCLGARLMFKHVG